MSLRILLAPLVDLVGPLLLPPPPPPEVDPAVPPEDDADAVVCPEGLGLVPLPTLLWLLLPPPPPSKLSIETTKDFIFYLFFEDFDPSCIDFIYG